jgi:hypothetical protein
MKSRQVTSHVSLDPDQHSAQSEIQDAFSTQQKVAVKPDPKKKDPGMPVLGIRVRIRIFLGLLDLDPSIIKQK